MSTKTSEDINRRRSVRELLTLEEELLSLSSAQGQLNPHINRTQVIQRLSSILSQEVNWNPSTYVAPTDFVLFNTKVTLVEAASFYMNLLVSMVNDEMVHVDKCKTTGKFDHLDLHYVGTDKGTGFSNIDLLINPNNLHHSNFVSLVGEVIEQKDDSYSAVDVLDMIISSLGLTSTESSAIYVALHAIEKGRLNGDAETSANGQTDSERLKPIIEMWLAGTDSLSVLAASVQTEFFV